MKRARFNFFLFSCSTKNFFNTLWGCKNAGAEEEAEEESGESGQDLEEQSETPTDGSEDESSTVAASTATLASDIAGRKFGNIEIAPFWSLLEQFGAVKNEIDDVIASDTLSPREKAKLRKISINLGKQFDQWKKEIIKLSKIHAN